MNCVFYKWEVDYYSTANNNVEKEIVNKGKEAYKLLENNGIPVHLATALQI